MVSLEISADRLKTIRKARKIGRPRLAKLTGLTERQVAKIETSATPSLSEAVVIRLSDALQVPLPTLTGEFALDSSDFEPASASKCTNGCCG